MPRAKNYTLLAVADDGTMTKVEAGPFYTEKAAAAHVRNTLPAGNYQVVRLGVTETSTDTSAPAIKAAVSAEAIAESPLPEGFISEAVAEDSKVSQENFEAPAVEFVDTDEIF